MSYEILKFIAAFIKSRYFSHILNQPDLLNTILGCTRPRYGLSMYLFPLGFPIRILHFVLVPCYALQTRR
jgi:hypothetical protein